MADGKVLIDTKLDDSGIDSGLKNMQSKLSSAGGKMKALGKNMTKSLTVPIVAMGTGAVMMAAKFDDSMRKVKATMGENLGSSTKEADANFKALREEALKLGATTAHSASDASAGMKELAQMGYDTNQILASTGTVLDVASASGLELDFVATTLAGSMNQFGIEVDDNGVNIKRFGDVMVRAGQMSGTSMEEIGAALEYVGSSAHGMGMDIEQTSAYIGILGDQNIKGTKAGNALNAMFRDMKNKVKDGNLEFEGFNVAMYDSQGNMRDMTDIMVDVEKGLEGMTDEQKAAAIQSVFGTQAQVALNAILGEGTDKVSAYEQELRNANDAAAIAAGEMEGGIGGAFRALASATEGLAISFGEVLVPVIQELAKFVAELFLKFIELTDGQKRAIVIAAAVVAAIGPILMIVGTLGLAIGGITLPMVAAGVAIAALIAIGILLANNWSKIKEKAVEVFGQFEPLLVPMREAFQTLKDSVEPIIERLKTLWQSLIPIFQLVGTIVGGVLAVAFGIVVGVINGVITALGPFIQAFISLVDVVANTVNAIVALFQGDFAGAWQYLQDAGGSAIDFFLSALQSIVGFVKGFVDGIVGFFKSLYMILVGNSIIPDMVNEIVDWFKNMVTWVIDLVKNIVDGVKRGFEAMKKAVEVVMKAIQSVMTTIWNAIKTVVTTVVNAIKTVITTVWNAIKSTITSIMNGIRSVMSSVWNTIKSVVSNVVNGIRNVVTSVFNAIRSVISSVMNSISSTISSIWNTISSVISSVTSAIKSTISNIFNSLKGIVSSAMNGVSSAVRTGINAALKVVTGAVSKFFNAGKDLIKGLVDGIKNMKDAAVNAITGVVDGVVNKAKSFLKIKSPSRVFKEIGEFTVDGLTEGIDSKRKEAVKATEQVFKDIKATTNKANKDIKAINSKAQAEESKLLKHFREDIALIHSKAKKAKIKVTKAESIRIRRLEEDTQAKIKKVHQKSANDIAKINKDKNKELGALKAEEFKIAKEWIDYKKSYEEYSMYQQYQDWQAIQKQYVIGSKEREEADKQLLSVKQDIHNELTNINDSYLKQVQDLNKQLIDEENKLNEQYESTLDSRAKSYYSFAGIFDEVKASVAVSGQELMNNLQGQVDSMVDWVGQIETLSARGINEGLLDELRGMGPKAATELKALNSLTDEQLQEYTLLWQSKNNLARKQAERELVGMKEDTKKQIDELHKQTETQLDKLQKEWQKKIDELRFGTKQEFNVMTSDLKEIGKNSIEGMIEGLSSMEGALMAKAKSIADAVKSTISSALDIRSPSGWMRDHIGKNMMMGWIDGIDGEKSSMLKKSKEMSEWMKPNMLNLDKLSNMQIPLNSFGTNGSVTNSSNSVTNNSSKYGDTIITIVSPTNTPSENARQIKRVGKELARGY